MSKRNFWKAFFCGGTPVPQMTELQKQEYINALDEYRQAHQRLHGALQQLNDKIEQNNLVIVPMKDIKNEKG